MVKPLFKVKSAAFVTILSVPTEKATASAMFKSVEGEPNVKTRSPKSSDLNDKPLAVVKELLAVKVDVVTAISVVNVPATVMLAPITIEPVLMSRVVAAGMVRGSLTVKIPLIFRVPLPAVVKGAVAGIVRLLDTVRIALFSNVIRLSSTRDNVVMVAFASTLMSGFVPVVETLFITAPDPFSVKTLDALFNVIAFVLENSPCPVKFRVEAWMENAAPE